MRITRDVMAWALSGIMAGAVGWLLFLAAHAFLITSIWDRAFTGLPFAALGGLTLACAMRSFEIRSLKGSIGFGVLVWALLLPPTAVASWLRVTGIRHEMGNWDIAVDITIAVITGYVAGRTWRRETSPALILAASTALLVLAMAGPIPVSNSRRAAMLFLAFLPMYILGCLTVGVMRALLIGRSAPSECLR